MVRGLQGGIESLWPETVIDMPYDLQVALGHSLMVISWYENLPEDEHPPRHIWWSEDLLEKWFEEVKETRSSRTGGRKRSSYDEADDVPMSENELAAEYREQMLG